MTQWFSKKSLGALLFCMLLTPAHAGIIVNLDASTAHNQQTLSLSAGLYQVQNIGIADGGSYDAWNAWKKIQGCDNDGTGCKKGWINAYFFTSDAHSAVKISDGERYATAIQAQQHALNYQFSLAQAGIVTFYLDDTKYSDNQGGISLKVFSIAAPASLALMLLIIGGMGLLTAKRKVKQS